MTGRSGKVGRERGITLIFEEDRLVRIEGDVVPDTQEDTDQLQVDATGR